MNRETAASGESAFASVALFPLRAIERARGWRRLGLVALYGLTAVVAWALLWRQSQLVGLPDVGGPFDESASRALARVPDDRYAFVLYRRAAEAFRDMSDAEGDSFSKANLRWSGADPALRGWVAENAEAIALLREGSGRPEAELEVPRQVTPQLESFEKSTIATRLSWIGTAALFEAGRLRASGDPDGAWALLKAVVRASRHMVRGAPSVQGRWTATILVQYARGPIAEWAGDPSVGVDRLKGALSGLVDAESLTPSPSLTYRAEYLVAMGALADARRLLVERAGRRAQARAASLFDLSPDLEGFLRREPERSRRVLNLLIANDLAWCDRPPMDRPGLAVPRLHIYDPDPAAPPASRALPPDELARWADSSVLDAGAPWRKGQVEQAVGNDRWSMGQLKEAVAVALFRKEQGRPPATPAEALRRYLPSPGDTPGRDEAAPVPAPK